METTKYEASEFLAFFSSIKRNTCHNQLMYISIFVDDDDVQLKKLYVESALKHNEKIIKDPHYYDAGFDLFLPANQDGCSRFLNRFHSIKTSNVPSINKIDFKVKCCAKIYNVHNSATSFYTPFYTYARSSMSKTPLRLANNQGIIDAGYRGNLIGMFDCIRYNSDDICSWNMENYSRMLQICAPSLMPIFVDIVDSIEELGEATSRGEGGIGSTGK